MTSQHLSDEAVAAYADGVLRGHPRERAGRHLAGCTECARAVRVQREAVLVLRSAPPPPLPTGLLDRLRAVPSTTPLDLPPTTLTPDGTTVFPAYGTRLPDSGFAPFGAAALVPPTSPREATHRARFTRPVLLTAAAVVTAGAFAVGSGAAASTHSPSPVRPAPAVQQGNIAPAGFSGR